jgi:hypothetical protein
MITSSPENRHLLFNQCKLRQVEVELSSLACKSRLAKNTKLMDKKTANTRWSAASVITFMYQAMFSGLISRSLIKRCKTSTYVITLNFINDNRLNSVFVPSLVGEYQGERGDPIRPYPSRLFSTAPIRRPSIPPADRTEFYNPALCGCTPSSVR